MGNGNYSSSTGESRASKKKPKGRNFLFVSQNPSQLPWPCRVSWDCFFIISSRRYALSPYLCHGRGGGGGDGNRDVTQYQKKRGRQ